MRTNTSAILFTGTIDACCVYLAYSGMKTPYRPEPFLTAAVVSALFGYLTGKMLVVEQPSNGDHADWMGLAALVTMILCCLGALALLRWQPFSELKLTIMETVFWFTGLALWPIAGFLITDAKVITDNNRRKTDEATAYGSCARPHDSPVHLHRQN